MSMITEGAAPFADGETWYRITDPDEARPDALPLVVLHGGPGMAHDYVRNIAELADQTGRQVVHYDQFGCGRSSHRPDAEKGFWTPTFFVAEFHSLIGHLGLDQYHLLGQSWGGMLGAEIAVDAPTGLASLSICNSPASMELWMQGAGELREKLPENHRRALDEHEADDTLDHPDYIAATDEFYLRHVCRMAPTPTDFTDTLAQLEKDPTVYHTMNGPNEFHVVGTLGNWSIIDRLGRVVAPTLVVAGEFDEATPATWAPYAEHIADVRTHVFAGASHCSHLEFPTDFREVIADFLAEFDK